MYPDSIDRLCELTRKPATKQRQHIAPCVSMGFDASRHQPSFFPSFIAAAGVGLVGAIFGHFKNVMAASKTLQRISTNLLLIMAVVGIVCWPVLASASCCCKRAERAQSIQSIHSKIAGDCGCCCGVSAKKSACCQTKTKLVSASQNTNACQCGSDFATRSDSSECNCNDSCKKFTARAVATPEIDQLVERTPGNTEASVIYSSPYSLLAINEPVHEMASFRAAQDQCALMCRWLK